MGDDQLTGPCMLLCSLPFLLHVVLHGDVDGAWWVWFGFVVCCGCSSEGNPFFTLDDVFKVKAVFVVGDFSGIEFTDKGLLKFVFKT